MSKHLSCMSFCPIFLLLHPVGIVWYGFLAWTLDLFACQCDICVPPLEWKQVAWTLSIFAWQWYFWAITQKMRIEYFWFLYFPSIFWNFYIFPLIFKIISHIFKHEHSIWGINNLWEPTYEAQITWTIHLQTHF